MGKRITIVQGHPDPASNRFGHALAEAYATGSREIGHEVRQIDVAKLDFPLLRTKEDFDHGHCPPSLRQAAEDLRWADHIVIFFPLWLGTMPALLKGFLEQVFRPQDGPVNTALKGKTSRIVVTMGMPALLYRWYFRAHGLKGLEKSVLRFCGMGRIRESLIGLVDNPKPETRQQWLSTMRRLGEGAL